MAAVAHLVLSSGGRDNLDVVGRRVDTAVDNRRDW